MDLIANQTDGIAGSGVKLATGDLVFDSGNEFGVYHGPAIVSDVFRANKDQFLKLDYSAAGDMTISMLLDIFTTLMIRTPLNLGNRRYRNRRVW